MTSVKDCQILHCKKSSCCKGHGYSFRELNLKDRVADNLRLSSVVAGVKSEEQWNKHDLIPIK
jgi:hypothetical protein